MGLAFLLGAFFWGFLEYALHNWLFHLGGASEARVAGSWRRLLNRNFGRREHLHHHADPTYFSPLWLKVAFAVPVVGAIDLAGWLILPAVWAHAFALGVALGWSAYELFHWLAHVSPPRTALGAALRKHHFHHHFVAPHMNHGVTSMLWDRVFGTFQPAREQVPVPEQQAHALSWVLDAGGRGIAARYAQDYTLSHRPG